MWTANLILSEPLPENYRRPLGCPSAKWLQDITDDQSINARFVGRRYTTRPGAPAIVSCKHDQKVHSWVVFGMYSYQYCHEGLMEECSRRLGRSRRSHVHRILFLFLAERKPLSSGPKSISATGCRNCFDTGCTKQETQYKADLSGSCLPPAWNTHSVAMILD